MSRALVIASGGLDSTVAAYLAKDDGFDVTLLSVDYGQRHRRELDALTDIARTLGAPVVRLTLPDYANAVDSALTTPDRALPDGAYAPDTIGDTTVPGRNLVLVALAASVAASRGLDTIVLGIHGNDTTQYPDTTPAFLHLARQTVIEATGHPLQLIAPFLEVDKAQIVRMGDALGVPFALTWSCYEGGTTHCGRCATCHDRRTAFALAGVVDPTAYDAPDAPRNGETGRHDP